MTTLNARTRLALLFVVGPAMALAACSSRSPTPAPQPAPTASSAAVPRAFTAACGHPGATVTVDAADLPITVSHAACDLSGATIRTASGSDGVPGQSGIPAATQCHSTAGCPAVSVNPATLDVTVS